MRNDNRVLALAVDRESIVDGAWQIRLIGRPALVAPTDQETPDPSVNVLIEEEPHASRRHRLVPDDLNISSFEAGIGLEDFGDIHTALQEPLDRRNWYARASDQQL